jgi:hypothetical protein
MAQQVIGIGAAPNDGTGDNLRTAGGKINDNFTELYAAAGAIVRWDFTAEGGLHPVDLTKVYISTDDSVYPENTWFASDGVGGWYTK